MRRFRPIQVLLVEDNVDDVEITRRALNKTSVTSELLVVRDGKEALDALFQGQTDRASGPGPDFVLLDINLPKVNGFEVLRQIRAREELSTLPVVMLTASAREEDVMRSYQLGANTFIQKPVVFDQFLETLAVLGRYWFEVATLPGVSHVEEVRS